MSVIAKAIAARQSEIERLQAEIKALNDVDKILGTSAPAKPAARRSSARRPAAAATPVAETASAATPAEEAPSDDGQREGGGVRADESLLGRAQKESREVARCPPPAALRISPPRSRREVEPDPLEVVVLRGTVTALGGLPKSSPGRRRREDTNWSRLCLSGPRRDATATPTSRGTDDQPVDLSIGSDTAPGGRRGPPAARPQLPFDGCGETQGQEEPLCDAS